MKKVLLTLAVLAVVAMPAMAFDFEIGRNLGKMADWGSFGAAGTDRTDFVPFPTRAPSVGDFDITVATITQLYSPDVAIPLNKYYDGSSPQLVALFYDLQVSAVIPIIPPGTRGAADPGAFSVQLSASGRQAADGSPYVGGRVDIWESGSNALNPAGAGGYATDWTLSYPSGANWFANPFDAGEYDAFPTASIGTPILSGTLVDPDGVGAAPLLSFYLDYFTGSGFNNDFGYIDIVYNNNGTIFAPQTTPGSVPYDISFFNNFTFFPSLTFQGQFEPRVDDPNTAPIFWNSESQDPIRFTTLIPEPATITLLGTGLAGLIGLIRRRK